MQPIGFVLLIVGIMLGLGAKRIIQGKTQIDEQDKEEFEMLAAGGVIAVRVTGFIISLVGLLFMIL